jgi:hypothetical protein
MNHIIMIIIIINSPVYSPSLLSGGFCYGLGILCRRCRQIIHCNREGAEGPIIARRSLACRSEASIHLQKANDQESGGWLLLALVSEFPKVHFCCPADCIPHAPNYVCAEGKGVPTLPVSELISVTRTNEWSIRFSFCA